MPEEVGLKYTAEYIADKLEQFSDAAYGWNIDGMVVGMKVVDFERLMDQAAEMIREKQQEADDASD